MSISQHVEHVGLVPPTLRRRSESPVSVPAGRLASRRASPYVARLVVAEKVGRGREDGCFME